MIAPAPKAAPARSIQCWVGVEITLAPIAMLAKTVLNDEKIKNIKWIQNYFLVVMLPLYKIVCPLAADQGFFRWAL